MTRPLPRRRGSSPGWLLLLLAVLALDIRICAGAQLRAVPNEKPDDMSPPARPILVSSFPLDPKTGKEVADTYTNFGKPLLEPLGSPGHDVVLSGVIDTHLGIRFEHEGVDTNDPSQVQYASRSAQEQASDAAAPGDPQVAAAFDDSLPKNGYFGPAGSDPGAANINIGAKDPGKSGSVGGAIETTAFPLAGDVLDPAEQSIDSGLQHGETLDLPAGSYGQGAGAGLRGSLDTLFSAKAGDKTNLYTVAAAVPKSDQISAPGTNLPKGDLYQRLANPSWTDPPNRR